MKAPKLADIPEPTPETSFTERAKVAKKPRKKSESAAKPTTKKISATIFSSDEKYVFDYAIKMSQKRGKSVGFSEALRTIIQEHKAKS